VLIASRRRQARAARHQLESPLDALGWRWHPGLSRLIDLWLVVEEAV
jgi:hypothetical protein